VIKLPQRECGKKREEGWIQNLTETVAFRNLKATEVNMRKGSGTSEKAS
jgi:molybdate-binding protein